MAARKSIVLFVGSTRDGRFGERVTRFASDMLKKFDLEPVVFDPLKMDFSMLKQPIHFMPDPSKAPQWLLEANEKIKKAHGFLVVTPEYNCSLPPALANMIDHFPPPSFRHRPCGIITYSMGPFGGTRLAASIRPFLSEMGMVSTPFPFVIPTVQNNLDENGTPLDERLTSNCEKLLKELKWYANALAKQTDAEGIPTTSNF